MDLLIALFGKGKDLDVVQMSCRGIAMFFIGLVVLRISGRRSFGVRTPLDNIVIVLLDAIMSRAVVGASPFIPVIVCCLTISIVHRLVGWLIVSSKFISHLLEGSKIILYENGNFIEANLKKGLVCKADVMLGLRKAALSEKLELIDKIYIERTGEISVVKKAGTSI